jgi:hypothetical protein
MDELRIYHGSFREIRNPIRNKGKIYNDYGQGFYCTKYYHQAAQWACKFNEDGIVSEYAINLKNLDVLDLNEEFHILNWLALLCDNRNFTDVVQRRNAEYIKSHFLLDYKRFDLIIGYRADDAYFKFVRDFLSGSTGLKTLQNAMYLGDQGLQVFVQSERAFNGLRFISSKTVDEDEHYIMNIMNVESAKGEYELLRMENENSDIFIRDIKGGDLDDRSIPRIKII